MSNFKATTTNFSRLTNFSIIDSTLREGEQFAFSNFTSEEKRSIAKKLSDFGVEYLELTNPAASEQSKIDCKEIANMGLNAKVLTHIRCHMDDARAAVECGVDGVNIVFGTSKYLQEFSHGKNIEFIIQSAKEVIEFVKSYGMEVRFSTEDSFRSDLVDLLKVYREISKIGVNRIGIADTVGVADPRQVYKLVRTIRSVADCDIEFHAHNDTGCAIANCFAALEAGVTHIDTTILGIGERNGINPLGGFVARMYTVDPAYVKNKYNIKMLKELEDHIAEITNVQVPFNNYITGSCAFSHKAGIHAKAILNNPSTYEVINPEDFGASRQIHIAHRLTGWNAVKKRADFLKLGLTESEIKEATNRIKTIADQKCVGVEEVDNLLRNFRQEMSS